MTSKAVSNVLPVIEMPKPPEPEPEPLFTNAPDNKLPENASGMDLMSAVISDFHNKEDLSDDDIIKIDEREIPSEDEVFNDPPPKVKAVSLEDEEAEEPSEFPQKKGKRKYNRKAPMSDKQKEHLAKIRKIAQEKRKAEKEKKQKEKEEAVIEKAEKRILEKKKKEEEKLEKEQKEQHEKINSVKPPKVQNGFTKEDLDNAVLSAISQYDTLRKQQKKEKRELERKKLEEEKMRATLARAIQPQQIQTDPWRSLFS